MMKKYRVTGIMLNQYDSLGRFEQETMAVSGKKAVSNIRFRLMKTYGHVLLRDVDVVCLTVDTEINLFREAI